MPTVAPINPLGEKEIAAMLESYADAKQAASMAHAVAQDMSAIGFDIFPSRFNPPGRWDSVGAVRQAEYRLPASDFDINSRHAELALEGSFLTCGNLLRLAQCCILGRKHIPTLWPSAFTKLLNGKKHLDTLNEVWWLKFWRDIVSVERGPKMSANDPDFEWEIRIKDGLAPCTINLEAKRRTSNINQLFKKRRPGASTKRIAHKFRAVPDDTANVAALTLFQNIPDSEVCQVHDWFMRQKHLHGLVIWTEGNLGGEPLRSFFKDSHRWAQHLLKNPEPEDLKIAGFNNGTLCEATEAPRFVEALAAKARIVRPWQVR